MGDILTTPTKLSRRSCIIKVESLYDSSLRVSNSAIGFSKVLQRVSEALTSNGIIKSLLGKMAGLVRGVEDLVVKDRKV